MSDGQEKGVSGAGDAGARRREAIETSIPFQRDVALISVLFVALAGISYPLAISCGFSPAVAPLICVPTGVLLHMALAHRRARKVRRTIDSAEQSAIAAAVPLADDALCALLKPCARESANTILSFRNSPLRWVAVARARQGLAGRAVRIADHLEDLPPIGPPLAIPFEPAPLSERSELVVTNSESMPTNMEIFRERIQGVTLSFGRSRAARGVHLFFLILGVLGVLAMLTNILGDLLRGRRPALLGPIFIGLAGSAPVLLMLALFTGWRQERWFVVPGAILVRRSAWWSQQSEILMFRRDESVLIQWLDSKQLAVGSADGRMASTAASPRMAELAFRAWWSPLPPPSIERLSDLGTAAK